MICWLSSLVNGYHAFGIRFWTYQTTNHANIGLVGCPTQYPEPNTGLTTTLPRYTLTPYFHQVSKFNVLRSMFLVLLSVRYMCRIDCVAATTLWQYRSGTCIFCSSTMLDLSALKPHTLHTQSSIAEPHLYVAPIFQLPALADVSFSHRHVWLWLKLRR